MEIKSRTSRRILFKFYFSSNYRMTSKKYRLRIVAWGLMKKPLIRIPFNIELVIRL